MSSTYMIFRYTFSIINLFFFIIAVAIVATGWRLHIKSDDYSLLFANRWLTAPVVLLVCAKVAILLGILGCLGAWFEKKILLFLYIFTMVLLFVALLVGVVFVIAFNESSAITVRDDLLERIHQSKDEGDEFRQRMNQIQNQFSCCGIDSYQDWYAVDAWPGQTPSVPDSCCLEKKIDCGKRLLGNVTLTKIHPDGCFHRLQSEINEKLVIVGVLAFVLVSFEGFCIIAALGILCFLRQRDSYI